MSSSSALPNGRWHTVPSPEPVCGYRLHETAPLHQLFLKRMYTGRDLKIITTAENAATGTGKTTLAFWLAMQWHSMFAPDPWTAREHAMLDVRPYLDKYRTAPSGTVLIMDEAEQLDARRSNTHENVDFSHYWMMMRVRQVVSILTLPSTSALDSRLEELADVWIEVTRRGLAVVHDLRTNSYSKKQHTPKIHYIEWPDVSEHPQMKALDEMKQEKINRALKDLDEAEEQQDPEEAKKDAYRDVAQRMRDKGATLREIEDKIPFSRNWVSEHTTPRDDNDE